MFLFNKKKSNDFSFYCFIYILKYPLIFVNSIFGMQKDRLQNRRLSNEIQIKIYTSHFFLIMPSKINTLEGKICNLQARSLITRCLCAFVPRHIAPGPINEDKHK